MISMKRFLKIMITTVWIAIIFPNIAFADNATANVNFTNQAELKKTPSKETKITESTHSSTIKLSNDELYALQKLKIQNELENEILSWLQSRFWFISIVTIVIGIFGIRALVRELVSSEIREAMRASAEAQAAANSARESIKDLRTETENYKDLVNSASTAAEQVNIQLEELGSRIDSEGERSIAAAELKISAINHQVEELQNLISKIAEDSGKSRAEVEASKHRLEISLKNAKLSEEKFSNNSETNVTIVPFENKDSKSIADNISSKLTHSGFKTTHSPWGGTRRQSGGFRIAYMEHAKDKAIYIKGVIEKVLEKMGIEEPIKMKTERKPISNSSSEVVVFFE